MTFPKGSLLLVDFTGKIKDTDTIFDSTSIAPPDSDRFTQRPKLVSIGDATFPVIEGFAEALAEAEVEKEIHVEVPPEKGFGERDSGKIRMVPLRKFGDDADKISAGESISLDGKRGIVRFIGSGRVQMDYNHRYAGKTIVFDATVRQHVQSDNDIVAAIIADRLDSVTPTGFEITDGEVRIDVPASLFRSERLQAVKSIIQSDIFAYAGSLSKVHFVETFVSKKMQDAPPPKPDPAPEPTESAAEPA